jgi:hypothetical protein
MIATTVFTIRLSRVPVAIMLLGSATPGLSHDRSMRTSQPAEMGTPRRLRWGVAGLGVCQTVVTGSRSPPATAGYLVVLLRICQKKMEKFPQLRKMLLAERE